MTFGITPVAGSPFAEQTADGFPQFIQWQADGTNLGGPDADVVNITDGLTVTRGVGENANVITLSADTQLAFEQSGAPISPVTTLNLADGLTVGLVNGVLTVQVAGAPPQTFIQWYQDGTPLGDDAVHHVNVLTPLLAARLSGLGASEIVLTSLPPQWLSQGLDEGHPDVIDVGDNLTLTLQSGNVARLNGVATPLPVWEEDGASLGRPTKIVVGTGITVSVPSGEPNAIMLTIPQFAWTDVPGDHTLQTSDLNNGLSTSGTTGTQNIIVAADAQLGSGDLSGKSVLIYVEGAAGVDVLPVSGVNVHVRSGLTALAAGQYATMTLIHTRHANDWVLCGDLNL